jgi:hypothetical protein
LLDRHVDDHVILPNSPNPAAGGRIAPFVSNPALTPRGDRGYQARIKTFSTGDDD